jgi:hypothetical protein
VIALQAAYELGLEVHDQAVAAGRQDKYVHDSDADRHRRGLAQAAQALAAQALEAEPVNGPFEVDGGRGDLRRGSVVWEVRHSRYPELQVFPRDPEAYRYVLVLGQTLEALALAGWIPGREARNEAWFEEERRPGWVPRYFVPLHALYPIGTRPLVCARCAETVRVTEAPREWIDPALYVCGTCLRPAARPQLELVGRRSETPAYDPSQMAIPY